jgi:hypothetical protein
MYVYVYVKIYVVTLHMYLLLTAYVKLKRSTCLALVRLHTCMYATFNLNM